MADVSIPGLATIAPVTGDSLPLERAATSLLDRRVTVDALKTFAQAGLATVATTGAYADLSGRPTLAPVATSGLYTDLTAKPTLATVAGTGAYSDLTGKPALATVATTGVYTDLTSRPTLGTVAALNTTGSTANFLRGDGAFAQPASPTGTTVTATGVLPLSSLGAVTPVNAAGAVVLTLPDAATSFAAMPYGLVVLSQKGAGAPTFAPAGTDSLRATSGIAASVQYGMIAAQIISATEWALA